MKIYNKVVTLILIAVLLCSNNVFIFAHEKMLDVEYDSCGVPRDPHGQIERMDGEDELWYWLIDGYCEYHISNEVQTIKYYFADDAKGSDTYTWTTDLAATEANEIKEAYANSMKKWDNIYYYSYDENGNRIANKIINVVEGTLTDHNLIIYPTHNKTFSAQTFYSDNNAPCLEMNDKKIGHFHYEYWWMEVNIDVLKEGYPSYNVYRERTGEHELGHVLGIFDVDEHCKYSSEMQHHEELLMGYGYGARSTYARYKDIAGVAITRGFHTDNDHLWMLRINSGDSYDVICALCNGVKFEVQNDIQDIEGVYYYLGEKVPIFGSCNSNHNIDSDNMLLVATDGVRDFYKCLCCRYIEEVPHSTHSYTQWAKYSSTHHILYCEYCGQTESQPSPHIIKATDSLLRKAKCLMCGAWVNLDNTIVMVPGMLNVQKVSINGSYILPNGIIVLVDEDIEAYENGTLVFYDKDDLPVTQ